MHLFYLSFLFLQMVNIIVTCQKVSGNSKDFGKALFLTPYIESGNLSAARRLARVTLPDDLKLESYAGFFTVNKTYDSNQFLWYFPAIGRNNADAPVLVWLQGGPGMSSLFGLFNENGPLSVKNGRFIRRTVTWALTHHIIYIDNPVGTGFSFTNDTRGYTTDETQVGDQLYSTVIQFFQLFPELRPNKFFVTGESYGGKYAPALAHTIHRNYPAAKNKINLKGIAFGNGFCDPIHQLFHGKYLYQIGLIDWNQAEVFEEYENKIVEYIKNEEYEKAFYTYDTLIVGIIDGNTVFKNMTGFDYVFNYLKTKDNNDYYDYELMLRKAYVRNAIHVGDLEFHNGTLVGQYLTRDIMMSVAPWISELLDHYNVLIYNGQVDILVPYPMVVNYLRNLNFTGSEEYKTAKRHVWEVEGDVAGYVKQAGKLVEVMVRNAGHMVPIDQPKWMLDLITRFTHDKGYD